MIRPLSKYQIRNMAYASRDPLAYLLRLYRYAIPEFDQLDKILAYPTVSIDTASYMVSIGRSCFGFNFLYLWLQKGFTADSAIHDGIVVYGGHKMRQYLMAKK